MKRMMVLFIALLSVAQFFACGSDSNKIVTTAQVQYDLDGKGPYAVGFKHYTTSDPSRTGDGKNYFSRPIALYVWYPVDLETIKVTTPVAVYPLYPLYDDRQLSSSSDWEKYGVDRAYQAPMASMRGPFPLLVFSHGSGSTPFTHTSLATRLASHGFVVAAPYHYGDGRSQEPGDPIPVQMYNRPRDMSFVITKLLLMNQTPGSMLWRIIREDQIAAGGWSLGGYAALVLAGGDDDVCDIPALPPGPIATLAGDFTRGDWCRSTPPDPRVKAVINLDGSSWALHFNEMKRIAVPVIGIGQEWGKLLSDAGPYEASWHARQHLAISGRPAFRVDVFNANHRSFSDYCEELMVLRDLFPGVMTPELFSAQYDGSCRGITSSTIVHGLVSKYVAAFLETYLAGKTGYQEILTPEWALKKEPYIEFFTSERVSTATVSTDWPDDSAYFQHQEGR